MSSLVAAVLLTLSMTWPIPSLAGAQLGIPNETSPIADSQMAEHFQTPPASAHPWVFWMWLRVDTNREAITADIEQMHAKGIEGAILYDSGVGGGPKAWAKMVLKGKGYEVKDTRDFPNARIDPIPAETLESWTPKSREMVRWACREAGRVGVKICLTVGLAETSGPIEPEYGQQRLVWSEIELDGPKEFELPLPVPATAVPPTEGTESLLSPGEHPTPVKNAPPAPAKPKFTRFDGKEIAVLAVPDRKDFEPADVVNLTSKVNASGRLKWSVPAGKWKVLRFGYEPTGKKNAWGLFTDAMSTEALDKTWDVTIGAMLKEMTPEERKGLVAVEDDSWEAGESTWTKLFPAEFQKLRGYDIIPLLPALAGKSIAHAEGVRRDYYRTIADLIAKNHYGYLQTLASRNGLQAFSEASGPNSGQLDGIQNGGSVDVAMGEFWYPSIHRPIPPKRFMLRNAANASHIYGKRVTPCEAFTSIGPFWEETFFEMKNVADQAFADGCNLIVYHNWSHSPSVTARPGYAYFAGTLYGRTVTWWEQAPAFNAYVGRCSYMLQQGLPVADALYFRGDSIGQIEQMKIRPAIPAEGYDHDNCNPDVLLNRLNVKDGRLTLPDGMSYRILVLPEKMSMMPAAMEKIAGLVDAGATVVGPRPTGAAGMLKAEERAKFDALVETLWSGKKILAGPPDESLRLLNVPPDLQWRGLSDAGELDWIHRRAGDVDIYFIASRWDAREKVACTFRVSGKQPEIWDPVTGEIRDAVAFSQTDGRTTVPLEFESRQSVFIVFRKPIPPDAAGTAKSNYPAIRLMAKLTGAWNVSFDPKWGGPEKVTFDLLVDWTKRGEEGIRYYSGTAVYHKKFTIDTLPTTGKKLLLNLGQVHEIASVRLNGVNLGVIWTKPARIDITRAMKAGENDLEIAIVNLWPNRLIGDDSLPKQKRFTETNIHKFSKATPLLPSGLIGPVNLEIVDRQSIR